MQQPPPENGPPLRHLRWLAWLIAALLAGIALLAGSSTLAWLLRLMAAAVFALGTVLPRTFTWPYLAGRRVLGLGRTKQPAPGRQCSPPAASEAVHCE
jgi:hypothetical protein